jgi:hypothetical protein
MLSLKRRKNLTDFARDYTMGTDFPNLVRFGQFTLNIAVVALLTFPHRGLSGKFADQYIKP